MKPIDPRLLRYAPSARRYLAGAAAIALAQTAVTVAFSWLLADAITAVVEGRMPRVGVGWLVGVVLVRGILLWATEAWGQRAAALTGAELRQALLAAVGRRGPEWLAQRNQAALAVTAGHGLDALDPYFSRYVPQLVLTAIATPAIVLVMWLTDWPSGLTAALTLPLIPLFLVLIGVATRSVQRRQLRVLQQLAARFADTVQGLSTLRIFGRERRAAERMRATADQYRVETMRVLRFSFLSGFALELLSSLAVALIAVAVGFRLLAGDMALGVGLFVLLLAPEAFLPLRQVGVQFHAAAEGVAAIEDVFEVLEGEGRGGPAVLEGPDAARGDALAGHSGADAVRGVAMAGNSGRVSGGRDLSGEVGGAVARRVTLAGNMGEVAGVCGPSAEVKGGALQPGVALAGIVAEVRGGCDPWQAEHGAATQGVAFAGNSGEVSGERDPLGEAGGAVTRGVALTGNVSEVAGVCGPSAEVKGGAPQPGVAFAGNFGEVSGVRDPSGEAGGAAARGGALAGNSGDVSGTCDPSRREGSDTTARGGALAANSRGDSGRCDTSLTRNASLSRNTSLTRNASLSRDTSLSPDASPTHDTSPRGGTLVLRDLRVRDLPPVSFDAVPGTVTLIEGPSGAGKSSLFAALRGAASFEGRAELDGVGVRDLEPSSWLAWAGQRPGLLRGTVAENVALGSPPDAARIRRTLDAAGAASLDPETELGVQGAGLSGGQAQRVAVARALYRLGEGMRVLALDEPSSALDADTEADLWTTVRATADAGVTVLLISHRRSAREIADHVVELGVPA